MNVKQIREKLGEEAYLDYMMNLSSAFMMQTVAYGCLVKAEDKLRACGGFKFDIKKEFNNALRSVQKIVDLQDRAVTNEMVDYDRELDFLYKLIEVVRKRNLEFASDDVLEKLSIWQFNINERDNDSYNNLKAKINEK